MPSIRKLHVWSLLFLSALLVIGPVRVAATEESRIGCFGEADSVTSCSFGPTQYVVDAVSGYAGLMMMVSFLVFYVPGFPLVPADEVLFGSEVIPGSPGTYQSMATDFVRGLELTWHLQTLCIFGLASYSNSHFSLSFRYTMYELRWTNVYGDSPRFFGIDENENPYSFIFVGNLFYVCVGWIILLTWYFIIWVNFTFGNFILLRIRRQLRALKPPVPLNFVRAATVYALFTYLGLIASSTRLLFALETDHIAVIIIACLTLVVCLLAYFGIFLWLSIRLQQSSAYNSRPQKVARDNLLAAWKYQIHTFIGFYWKSTTIVVFFLRRGEWTIPKWDMSHIGHIFAGYSGMGRFYIIAMMTARLFLVLVICLTEWMPAIGLHIVLAIYFIGRATMWILIPPLIDRADNIREVLPAVLEACVFFLIAICSLRDYADIGLSDSELDIVDAQMEMIVIVCLMFRLVTSTHVFIRQIISVSYSLWYLVHRWAMVGFALLFLYEDPMMRVLGRNAEEEKIMMEEKKNKEEMRDAKRKLRKLQEEQRKAEEEAGSPDGGMKKEESVQRLQNLLEESQKGNAEAARTAKYERWLKVSRQKEPLRVQMTMQTEEGFNPTPAQVHDLIVDTYGLQNSKVDIRVMSLEKVLGHSEICTPETTPRDNRDSPRGPPQPMAMRYKSKPQPGEKYMIFLALKGESLLSVFELAVDLGTQIRKAEDSKLELLKAEDKGKTMTVSSSQTKKNQKRAWLVTSTIASDHDQYSAMVDVSVVLAPGKGIKREAIAPKKVIGVLSVALDIESHEIMLLRLHHQERTSHVLRLMIKPIHEHPFRNLKNKEFLNSETSGSGMHISKVRCLGCAEGEVETKHVFGMLGTYARMSSMQSMSNMYDIPEKSVSPFDDDDDDDDDDDVMRMEEDGMVAEGIPAEKVNSITSVVSSD